MVIHVSQIICWPDRTTNRVRFSMRPSDYYIFCNTPLWNTPPPHFFILQFQNILMKFSPTCWCPFEAFWTMTRALLSSNLGRIISDPHKIILQESNDLNWKTKLHFKSKVYKICWHHEYNVQRLGFLQGPVKLHVLFDYFKQIHHSCHQQKEACWLSLQINLDSCKCDVMRITMQIDSMILVES